MTVLLLQIRAVRIQHDFGYEDVLSLKTSSRLKPSVRLRLKDSLVLSRDWGNGSL